jgi:histidyl-tRNA synthetase
LYPEADKLGKQFKYASSLGVAFVAIIGEEEAAKGQVAIKDMQSGEQRALMRDQVKEFLPQRRKAAKEEDDAR